MNVGTSDFGSFTLVHHEVHQHERPETGGSIICIILTKFWQKKTSTKLEQCIVLACGCDSAISKLKLIDQAKAFL